MTETQLEPIVLTDNTFIPNNELIFDMLGDKSTLWQALLDYLNNYHSDISEEWKFYNDGKCWLYRLMKKKKTICWIGVLQSTFRVGFWFGAKADPIIEQSDLPEAVKETYRNAKKTKIGSGISVVMNDLTDVDNVIKLMELRIKIK
jgi:hypothetical protein